MKFKKKLILIFLIVINLIMITNITFAQKNISGTITDTDGESVPGASVILKGTTIGVMADIDGKYTLSVPDEPGVIVFSYIGVLYIYIYIIYYIYN